MEGILKCAGDMKRSELKKLVDARVKEFKETGEKSSSDLFKELCFCILTANFNAEKSIKIQKGIGDGFITLTESQLAKKLRGFGHRYPEARAKYIVEARKHQSSLKDVISSFKSENELREWLIKNIKGLGYKESSHFLRNIGFDNFAIIDFHIIDILEKYGLIERPKTLTKRKYLEIEGLLKKIAKELNLNLAELDLYLWYAETGKVLK
jgi:N-glycosylase/DNA lyase